MAMKPFSLDVHNWGMDQAFMVIERPPNREPLTDKDLADLKMTRARAMELIARLNAGRDRVLGSTGMAAIEFYYDPPSRSLLHDLLRWEIDDRTV